MKKDKDEYELERMSILVPKIRDRAITVLITIALLLSVFRLIGFCV